MPIVRFAFVVLLFAFSFLQLCTPGVCGNYFANVLRWGVVDANGPNYIYTTGENGRRWQLQALLQSSLGTDDLDSGKDDQNHRNGLDSTIQSGADGVKKSDNDGNPGSQTTGDGHTGNEGSVSSNNGVVSGIPSTDSATPAASDNGLPATGVGPGDVGDTDGTTAGSAQQTTSSDSDVTSGSANSSPAKDVSSANYTDSQLPKKELAEPSNTKHSEHDVESKNKSTLSGNGENAPPSESNPVDPNDSESTDVQSTDDVQSTLTTSKNTEGVTENTDIAVLPHVPPVLFLFTVAYICGL